MDFVARTAIILMIGELFPQSSHINRKRGWFYDP
jgi:hypothetical protein